MQALTRGFCLSEGDMGCKEGRSGPDKAGRVILVPSGKGEHVL